MRSDHTAEFIATRPYESSRALHRALYDHTIRVLAARRNAPDSELARQPMLTNSGTTIFSAEAGRCHKCQHLVGATFLADSTTHRIVSRSGNPTRWPVDLCVRCWSDTVRHKGDSPDLPVVEVRWA